MIDSLKSCPFCGNNKIQNDENEIAFCKDCPASVNIHAWNKRVGNEKLKLAIDKLLKAIDYSFDENFSRKSVNARFKSVIMDVQKDLGIAKK